MLSMVRLGGDVFTTDQQRGVETKPGSSTDAQGVLIARLRLGDR